MSESYQHGTVKPVQDLSTADISLALAKHALFITTRERRSHVPDNLADNRPLFQQIAEMLEDAILNNVYRENEQIPSITELSVAYTINPATALKGVNILVEQGLIYKKRGMGMFVAQDARQKLINKRKESFFRNYVEPLINEAEGLAITKQELLSMIEKGCKHDGN